LKKGRHDAHEKECVGKRFPDPDMDFLYGYI